MSDIRESIEVQVERLSYYKRVFRNSQASRDVAQALILFIKAQVLLCDPHYAGISIKEISYGFLEMINDIYLEKILTQVPEDYLNGINLDNRSRNWFLMKLMFQFDHDVEKRKHCCELLGLAFSHKSRPRNRIKQDELRDAYEKKRALLRKKWQQSQVIDLGLCKTLDELKEAFKYVDDAMRYRARLDQRLKRFREKVKKSKF